MSFVSSTTTNFAVPAVNVVIGQRWTLSSATYPQAIGSVADGVIGATTAAKSAPRKKSAKPEEKKETVAIFSTKNVTWPEVGKVYRGYNIVEKDAAEKWLTRSHIRSASPEEVAKEFGK